MRTRRPEGDGAPSRAPYRDEAVSAGMSAADTHRSTDAAIDTVWRSLLQADATDQRAIGGLPELDGAIEAARGEERAVVVEGDDVDARVVGVDLARLPFGLVHLQVDA